MWKLNPNDRLDHWKMFRAKISGMSLDQAIQECNDFWQRAPFTPFYLDYKEIDCWPDPWQLVYENCYCDLAKALGIVYTLQLSAHKNSVDLAIHICQNTVSRVLYNLVWINQGKYVLNYISDTVVNRTQVEHNLKTLFKLSSKDLKLENY